MKDDYKIRSERYGHVHHLIKENDYYVLRPEEDWMPVYVNFTTDVEHNLIPVSVDTEGGPYLQVGWSNDEIEIISMRFVDTDAEKKVVAIQLKEK